MRYVGRTCKIAPPVARDDSNGNIEWYGRCNCGWECSYWTLTAVAANWDTERHIERNS